MTSAAIEALRGRILTNTLTADDQAALAGALAEIAPTFPAPDEISNSIVDERLARTWIASLYTIQAEGTGPVAIAVGTLIFPDLAALEAFPNASLQTGQPIKVLSVGADWTLVASTTLPVDGITVVEGPDGRRYERGASFITEAAQAQIDWYVDPRNPAASDENTGRLGHPLKTKSEIARRYGTWAPNVSAVLTTIHYLSDDFVDSEGGGNDSGHFAPVLSEGATFFETAPDGTPDFVGTLASVSAKGNNQTLSSVVATTSGSLSVGMKAVNLTRGNSEAYVAAIDGEGVIIWTQPYTPYEPPGFPFNTEVDTWANGDEIHAFSQIFVDLSLVGGLMTSDGVDANGGLHVVANLTIDTPAGGAPTFDQLNLAGSGQPNLVACAIWRNLNASVGDGAAFPGSLTNCFCPNIGLIDAPGFQIFGGLLGLDSAPGVSRFNACGVGGDVILGDPAMQFTQVFFSAFAALHANVPAQVALIGTLNTINGHVYGPTFFLNVFGVLQTSGGTAAQIFVSATPPKLAIWNQLSTASVPRAVSTTYSSEVPSYHLVDLTVANLDVAAGPTGFGTTAIVPGVGAILTPGQQFPT